MITLACFLFGWLFDASSTISRYKRADRKLDGLTPNLEPKISRMKGNSLSIDYAIPGRYLLDF